MKMLSTKKPLKALIADDSASIRTLLKHTLTKMGYEVTECTNGTEVWKLIKKGTYFNIFILDWVMPGLSGLDICQKIRNSNTTDYQYILLLTGNDSVNDMIQGLESGADDYLVKPVSIPELKARIKIGERLFDYENRLKSEEESIRISCYKTLTELAEARDHETGSHLSRIAGLARCIAEAAGCSQEFCNCIEMFSPMHDIGKVGIPDGILHLPRRLTEAEFAIMKTHPEIGYQILKDKETLEIAAEIAYTHHEKWDGSGYPRGLSGENIPLSGRIVAIADTYDALRSIRPYKLPFDHDESARWIKESAGKAFDPDLIKVFEKVEHKLEDIFNSQYDPKLAEAVLKNTKTSMENV
jgi:putative two-component system response regulator